MVGAYKSIKTQPYIVIFCSVNSKATCSYQFTCVAQVSDVAHEPLVINVSG